MLEFGEQNKRENGGKKRKYYRGNDYWEEKGGYGLFFMLNSTKYGRNYKFNLIRSKLLFSTAYGRKYYFRTETVEFIFLTRHHENF